MPSGLQKRTLATRKSASFLRLWSAVHTPPSSLAPQRPLCVMSIHRAVHPFLFTSITLPQPPSFAFHCSYSPSHSLSLSINLPPPSLFPPLSACSTHSFHPLSVRNPPFTFTPSILPPLYNFSPYVNIPLVLCHSLSIPHLLFHPPLASLPQPYLSLSLISRCLSAVLEYFK